MNSINLNDYILTDETNANKGCIWLHNLPNDETLFDIINKIRNKYKDETFVITQNINITNEKINKEINFSNCIFKKNVNFLGCIFATKVNFLNCIFNGIVKFEETEIKKGIFVKNSTFFERVLFEKSVLENSYNDFSNGVVNFDNITFKDSILCSETSFENISFDNVQFKKKETRTSEFVLCSFSYVTFSNTIFEVFNHFQESKKVENISFKNTIFFGKTVFGYHSFTGKTNFLNCIFKPLTNTPDEQVLFSGSIFKGKTDFTGSNFLLKTNFSYSNSHFFKKPETCHFYDNVDFKSCIFSKETNFSGVIFEGDTNFSETIFGEKEDTSFYEVSFNDAKFNKVARFHSCNFYSNTKFENTSFNSLVDFYLSVFHKEQQFLRTDFLDIAVFSGVIFKKQVQFLYNKVKSNSYINFESSVFNEYLDISRANFNCNLNFWNVKIDDKIKYINTYTKYENDFGKYHRSDEIIKPTVHAKIRESFRILKNDSYKQNNKIAAADFYKYEMDFYREELNSKITKANSLSEKTEESAKNKIFSYFTWGIISYIIGSVILFFYLNIFQNRIFLWLSQLFFILSIITFYQHKKKNVRTKLEQSLSKKELIFFSFLAKLIDKRKILGNNYMPVIFLIIGYIIWFYNLYQKPNNSFDIYLFILIFISLSLLYIFFDKDRIILWLNKNSNEFDVNWAVGVNFSLLVGILTYMMILLIIGDSITFSLKPEAISNFINSLVDVFNITKWDNLEIIGVKLKGFSYLLLFIGRIFIGYGYYQTIQAFRKFGKS